MIQLAKNSTKARILANVEKWGLKVDKILEAIMSLENLAKVLDARSQSAFVKGICLREVWAQCLPSASSKVLS